MIAQLIQRSIARGQLSAAGVLSLAELAQRFEASSTEELQLALARLQSEGLIVMRGDLALVVRKSPMLTQVMSTPAGSSHKDSLRRDEIFSDGARMVGLTATGRSETTVEPASLDVADQLEIAVRTPIVHRQIVRYAGDEPAALENAYYPHDIVEPADPTADANRIIDAAGYRRVGWIDAVVARLANPDEATILGLDTSSPVMDHARVLYSRKDGPVRPVEYVRTLFAGSRHRLTYEYKQLDA
ncbi:GntR family transcriptional regulator [Kribbella sp. NPDC026596]|uniref:GntR family transcriptional regulator n=1 Tax=Kribbella sp. NPDC026596 TaxID=3155122 RepID=UPI0033F74162